MHRHSRDLHNNFFWIFFIIITIILFSVIFSPLSVHGEGADIWELIRQGEHEEALIVLEAKENIETDIDLRFARALLWSWQGEEDKAIEELFELRELSPARDDVLTHLIRVLGWQGRFAEAEKLAEDFMTEETGAEIAALLAVHAEWQQDWQLASSRWQQAAELSEREEEINEYLTAKETAERNMAEKLTAELETSLFSEGNYLRLGLAAESWLRPGLIGSMGWNLDKVGTGEFPEPAFNFSLRAEPPLLPHKLILGGGISYKPYNTRRVELNIGGGYAAAENHTLGLQTRIEALPITDRVPVFALTPEYTYKFDNAVLTFGNTLRREGNFSPAFSQHLRLNLPYYRWRPEITLRRFMDDSYQLQLNINLAEGKQEEFSLDSILINLNLTERDIMIRGRLMGFNL